MSQFYDDICQAVRSIPKGQVRTYGQIALMAGRPGAARQVGWVLHSLPEGTDIPWHRVVNAQGRISLSQHTGAADLQRARLESEAIEFDAQGKIDLGLFVREVEFNHE